MRDKPTLRIPLGIIALVIALAGYSLAVMWASQWIEDLPVPAQALVYLVLGTVWILPLRRYLAWMETGRWGKRPRPSKGRACNRPTLP